MPTLPHPPVALHNRAGFVVTLENGSALRFGPGLVVPPAAHRTAAEMRPFLRDPAPADADPNDVLYTLFRGVAPPEAEALIAQRGLLYVALVMRPGVIGEERVRTRGHTNSPAPGTPIAFPEIHEVWHGSALAYLQKEAAPDVSDLFVMTLVPGDKIVVPPGWASLLVNLSATEPLAVGSWRTAGCVPQYDEIAALGGMAHFVCAQGNANYRLEPNPNYRSVPVPRVAPAQNFPDFGLKAGEPMFTTFRRNPDFSRFLSRPQDYDSVWAALYKA